MAENAKHNYDESKIKTLSSLEHIRLRTGMYIGRIGNGSNPDDGCYVLLKEVVDNAIDEFIMGHGKEVQIWIEGNRVAVLNVITPDLRDAARWDDIFSWWMADAFALVGETEAALDAVQRMIELGIVNYPFLAEYEPFFSRLRSEPRFGQLMVQARERWHAFEP